MVSALIFSACASAPPATPSVPEKPSASAEADASEPAAANGDAASGSLESLPPGSGAEAPPDGKSLPEIHVRNVGLHVGGGRNDSASKEPFIRALEQRFPEFQRCYRLVEQPGQEGTFGVDIHVGRTGRVEKLEQPRAGLPGDGFRSCMLEAFEAVRFDAIPAPVVISYSVRFSLQER